MHTNNHRNRRSGDGRSTAFALLLTVSSVGASACSDIPSPDDADDQNQLSLTSQALGRGGEVTDDRLYRDANLVFCFEQDPASKSPGVGEFELAAAQTMNALQFSWAQVMPLEFYRVTGAVGVGCTSLLANIRNGVVFRMSFVDDIGSNTGGAHLGLTNPGPTIVELSFCSTFLGGSKCWGMGTPDDSVEMFRHTVIHEFGHTLGFDHEHLRAERPIDLPTWCPAAAEFIDHTITGLTPWYDDDSVMGYCRDQNRDRRDDGFEPWLTTKDVLSVGDQMGVQSLYPGRVPMAFYVPLVF